VLGERGEPLSRTGVAYRLQGLKEDQSDGLHGAMLTDETGRITVLGIEHGTYSLSLYSPGFLPAQEMVEYEEQSRPPELTVALVPDQRGTGTLAGRVFLPDGQTPVAGVFVAPFFPEKRSAVDRSIPASMAVATDPTGTFVFHGLRTGTYGVLVSTWITPQMGANSSRALRPEFRDFLPVVTSDPVEVLLGGKATLAVRLQRAASLEGRVFDADTNEPVGGASVRCSTDGRYPELARSRLLRGIAGDREDTTDAAGNYYIGGLTPGTWRGSVHCNGYDSLPLNRIVLDSPEVHTLDVRLSRPKVQTGSREGESSIH